MTLSALRDDALRTADGRTHVRVSLPWIRSLPLAGPIAPTVEIDGIRREPVIALGDRRIEPSALTDEDAWWYIQDRVVLEIPDGWELSASAFNLTPEVVRAERTAPELAATLVERGLARAIEIELGQMWRGFPDPPRAAAEAFRARLAQHDSRLRDEWRDPATHVAVVDHLHSGQVPAPVHTLYMDLLVRFGRANVSDLASVLPLLGAVHLKFWDLDDADDRLSHPLRDVGAALRATGFTGTLCSEWGGQEWLDDDPWEMTSRHLALAAALLSDRPISDDSPPQKASTR